jgi:hypothetical protein
MNIKKYLASFILFFFLCNPASAVPCNCDSLINFVSENIKFNYPGYKVKISSVKFEKILNKIRTEALKNNDCFYLASKLVLLFKDVHLRLYKNLKKDDYKNSFDIQYKIESEHEGYWIDELASQIVFLKKDKNHAFRYIAFVVISSDSNFKKGDLKFLLYKDLKGKLLTEDIRPKNKIFYYSEFSGKSEINSGYNRKWKKIELPHDTIFQKVKQFDFNPKIVLLDSNNLLIKIPSCRNDYAKQMDSLVLLNKSLILNTNNLIIDLRYNNGGSTAIFKTIIPLLYDRPYKNIDNLIWCSPSLIQKQKDYIENYIPISKDDSILLESETIDLDSMLHYKNKFYYKKRMQVSLDKIYNYPKKVAILFNHNCVSAVEIFLHIAIQSRKVITFGENTGGGIEYLEMEQFVTSDKVYTMNIPRIKTSFPHSTKIIKDNIGLAPDVKIPKSEVDWIAYVLKEINK